MALVVGQNSYIDVATANTYFTNRLFSDTWTNATTTQKEQALIMATRAIDRQVFIGAKKTDSQPLQFPRRYPFRMHDIWRKWFQENITDQWETLYVEGVSWWAETDVPQTVKDACCEEALALLERGNSQRRKLQQEGVMSVNVGNLSETYAPGSGRGLLSQEAKELLRMYLAGAVRIT